LQVNDRLYRSRDDRMIAGVAGGLAEQLGLDPSLVRVGWVILAVVTGGLLALAYLVMMVVVPEEPDDAEGGRPWRWSSGQTPPPQPDGTAGMSGTADGRSPAGARSGGDDRPTESIVPPEPHETSDATAAAASTAAGPSAAGPPAADRNAPASAAPGPGSNRDSWRNERAAYRDARHERRRARRADRHDGSSGPILLGLILVLVGAWLLARRYLPAADFDRLWPVGLVIAGIVLVVLSIRPGRDTP
jgi:phage shock protein C